MALGGEEFPSEDVEEEGASFWHQVSQLFVVAGGAADALVIGLAVATKNSEALLPALVPGSLLLVLGLLGRYLMRPESVLIDFDEDEGATNLME